MNDEAKEITHRNVLKLVDALKAERERTDQLTYRVGQLETQVQSLTIKMGEVQKQANIAFAVAQQGRL